MKQIQDKKKLKVDKPRMSRDVYIPAKHATKHDKHTPRRVHRVIKKTSQAALYVVKFTHFHTARRPHGFLVSRSQAYQRWHNWEKHQHVHIAFLSVYLVAVFILVGLSYQRASAASDLFDSWNFSTIGQFNVDNGIEKSGSSVRLKAQNYTTDANTKALYHFDETSGTNATDSSGNGNDATLANGSFTTGNLNNALSLNGTTSSVSIPDSPTISLSQQNTLETWAKLNTSLTAGNTGQRQGIVDKGDYQLYYDNETGKVTYELADNGSTQWSQAGGLDINGSWDTGGKRSVNAVVKMGSDIYAGIGVDIGDAAVWKWDGTTWTRIGGGPNATNNSWAAQTFEGVYTLTTDGTNLYAGLGLTAGDGEVWKWNGTSWSKIGGDGVNSSWAVNTFEQVWSLDYFDGKLYAGLGSSANDAEVWEWAGSSWTKIGGDSINSGWTTSYEIVGALTNDGTNLYAGLGVTAGDGEVWKWNGTSWSKIGGDGLSSSWNTNYETVRSLRYFGTKLYAGLGDTAGDAEVWEWSGSSWTKIGGNAVNSSWNTGYEQIGSFAWDGTDLYAGLGTSNGDGEVWKYSGGSWTQIGGDGLNSGWSTAAGDTVNTLLYDSGKLYAGTYDSAGSGWVYTYNGTTWTLIGGDYVNHSWGFYGVNAVQVMQTVGDNLYAGLGNTAGAALVWQYNGSIWTLIGGQGLNGSWDPNTYEQVLSMANYNGKLVIGLGTTANDAEVWEWSGSAWSQIGGDSINSGWGANFEEIDSLASDATYLYAGLGSSANDGEVWRWDGASWTKIGGDSINSGWTTSYDRVTSMSFYHGKLLAGLGSTSGEAEVWEWSGSAWSKVGGDGVSNSWPTPGYEQVESMVPYNDKLYVGLGNTTDDAEVWEYDGTTWTLVGGDDVNSSWTAGTYERVKTLAVYNGDLYAGLGSGAGDGEVWRMQNGNWTKVAGNGVNGGWSNTIEEVESFSAYKGKFYAGTGLSANADGIVWSWGNNSYLQSTKSSFDTNWHHIAATYDGTTMKIYVDGVLDASKATTVSLPDSSRPLLVGTTYGGREYGKARGYFDGKLDETRISDIARPAFTTKAYSSSPQTVSLGSAVRTSGVWHWDNMTSSETPDGGTVTYRLSADDGTTWKYWDGSAWSDAATTADANPIAVIDAQIASFPVTFAGIKWQAILKGNGTQQVALDSVNLSSTSDFTQPTNASAITALKAAGGSALAQNGWTNGSSPYFNWTAGSDGDSGIKGYCLYLGQDNTADPTTTKGLLGASPAVTGGNCQFMITSNNIDLSTNGYIASALTTSDTPYYLSVKAIDNSGNLAATSTQFYFRFDNTAPSNPGYITSPSGFINTKDVTLTWPTAGGSAPNDGNSGLAGMQYRINSNNWYGDSHTGSGDINDILANDGAYTTTPSPDFTDLIEGVNTVYFRTWDQAGNVTNTYVTAALKINTSGAPSEPQNLQSAPPSNNINSFAFSWTEPVTYVGNSNALTYCYSVNTIPSDGNCTFTGAGVKSLGAGPYATQPGQNTFYVTAKDESGNINYANFASVTFTANTPSPGIPLNTDIVDVSIKATENWRLALTWDTPAANAASVASYKIYRSIDNSTFYSIGSSSSTTYIDAGLTQQRYYYKVTACDSTNNCGGNSSTVNSLPTGKFTTPANLIAEPESSSITTKKAAIQWSTDRPSDSKIALGTSSGKYASSEVSSSAQVGAHKIELDNLSAGTTYYYVAKWTDEDGNTGSSQERTFKTAPAPSLKEVSTLKVTLSGATVQFTSKDATKVNVIYGKSEGFGGLKAVNTSTSESTYAVPLDGLEDGSKYFYKLVSYDSEGNTYDGTVSSFTTPARPRISDVRFQPVEGEPTSTQLVTWITNVPSTSVVIYGKEGTSGTETIDSEKKTDHQMTIQNLEDDSRYFLLAQSRDNDGNLAVSDRQSFKTALDTRPPKVSNITVETSIRGSGAEARGQVVVSWQTDEPSTSQVGYAEGSNATVFNSKTSEDGEFGTEHIVIVSDLPTSKVYSIQPLSKDRAGNQAKGETQSAIISRASDSVLTLILNSLQKVFGF